MPFSLHNNNIIQVLTGTRPGGTDYRKMDRNGLKSPYRIHIQPATTAMHGPQRFLMLVTVRLYTVMPGVCRWLTNEKQIKTYIRSTKQ